MSSYFADEAAYEEWARALHEERRFGPDDVRGTANLIDAAAQARAAAAISTGRAVSLARPLMPADSARRDGRPAYALDVIYTPSPGRPVGMGSDHLELDCHGYTNTHLDALNHRAQFGTWYGGRPSDGETVPPGLGSVDLFAPGGLVTRAVFVDVPAHRGVEYVDAGAPVVAADIDGALDEAGVGFEPGDALLLYMGRDRYNAAGLDWNPYVSDKLPGLAGDGGRWIVEHGASLLCWDMLDAINSGSPGNVHMLGWAIGLLLVDNCDFVALREDVGAATCVAGALVVAPLPMVGATGCNVNPLVIR